MSIKSVIPSSHLILCCPLLLLSPIPPSIRVFSNVSTLLMRWPKYWSFTFSISTSNEHPGLISFRMDWVDLLAVQGTLKNLLQHHSSKASIIQRSAFFIVQLTSIHDHWKNHSLDPSYIHFISFYCLITIVRTSTMMLKRSVTGDILTLYLVLVDMPQFFTFMCNVNCRVFLVFN